MATMRTVLVVDDEAKIVQLARDYLEHAGFAVLTAADGPSAVETARRQHPDLIVLDLGLPGLDGLEVTRELRRDSSIPIVMLTARDDEVDRVLGLEMGADDYLTKPFSPRELVARVKAILRRVDGPPRDSPSVIRLGTIEVDIGRREARADGQAVPLAAREFELLQYLAENPGLALSRRQLLDAVWGHDWVGDERTVDVHVRQLRKKLGAGLELATVWGVGYRLD